MSDLTSHAVAVDAAINEAFRTGTTQQGNNFEWVSHMASVEAAKVVIDSGIMDVEKIAAAAHTAWAECVKKDLNNELNLDIVSSDERKRKRLLMTSIPYEHFPGDEKEKYRVIARTMLRLLG